MPQGLEFRGYANKNTCHSFPMWAVGNQVGVPFNSHFTKQRPATKKKRHHLSIASTSLVKILKNIWKNPTKSKKKTVTLRIIGPSKLTILRTLPLLYRFKPFHWRVQKKTVTMIFFSIQDSWMICIFSSLIGESTTICQGTRKGVPRSRTCTP